MVLFRKFDWNEDEEYSSVAEFAITPTTKEEDIMEMISECSDGVVELTRFGNRENSLQDDKWQVMSRIRAIASQFGWNVATDAEYDWREGDVIIFNSTFKVIEEMVAFETKVKKAVESHKHIYKMSDYIG